MPVIPAAHLLGEFVDRSSELEAFRKLLDGQGPPILRISGSGGMGKSSLLSRFMSECDQRKMRWIHLEWRDSRRYNYLDIMRRVRQESDPALFDFFNDRVNFYTVAQYKLQIDLQGGNIQDVKVQVGGLLSGSTGPIHIGHNIQIPDSMINVLRPDQALNESTVIIEITSSFMPCLRAALEATPLVLILDATEKADALTRSWIHDELFTRVRDRELSRLFLVEAGRDLEPLDTSFDGLGEDRVLSKLQEPHVEEYIARKGLPDHDHMLARFVYTAYDGHPQQIAIAINKFLKSGLEQPRA
jgi:hypothetical protein